MTLDSDLIDELARVYAEAAVRELMDREYAAFTEGSGSEVENDSHAE